MCCIKQDLLYYYTSGLSTCRCSTLARKPKLPGQHFEGCEEHLQTISIYTLYCGSQYLLVDNLFASVQNMIAVFCGVNNHDCMDPWKYNTTACTIAIWWLGFGRSKQGHHQVYYTKIYILKHYTIHFHIENVKLSTTF